MRRIVSVGVIIFIISMLLGGCNDNKEASGKTGQDETDVIVITTQKHEEETASSDVAQSLPVEQETTTIQEETTQQVLFDYSTVEAISQKEYEGYELEWEVRDIEGDGFVIYDLLKTVIKDRRILAEYEYDGYKRISKHMDGVTTYFTYNVNGGIATADDGTHRLEYMYAAKPDGERYFTYKDGFIYNEEKYYFMYGASGLIEGIEKDGKPIARYLYDGLCFVGTCSLDEYGEWVINEDEEFIGNINKIRHAGIYYDEETGWYSYNLYIFDPVNNRNVSGVAPEIVEGIFMDYSLGIPVDEKYLPYGEISISGMNYKLTGMSYIEAYSDINEPLVAARRGSAEWKLLNDNYKVEQQYAEYAVEYPDRRFTTPSIIVDSNGTKKCVYTGVTQEGKNITVSHSTGNALELSYNGKKVTLDVWEFKDSEGNLRPVQVFFRDMNKDSIEELVLVWDTILMIDIETLSEIQFFVKQRGYYCYKITDEEAKAMDDLIAKEVPDHKYTSSGSGCYGGWDYYFAVEGDRIYYYRDDKVDGELQRYLGRIVYEYDGTQFAKSYELATVFEPYDESVFKNRFTRFLKTVYYNLINDMPGGKYEAYFGTVEDNKVWNLKVYYDNIDYNNYAIEIYDGEKLVSRSFWKEDTPAVGYLVETEVNSFMEEEYSLLYELDLTL